jgi:HIRAN domain
MVVDVEHAERYWYPDDGGQVWLAGYQLVDPESGAYLGRDAPLLAERELRVSGVAGTQFRPGALESDALAPGRPLALRREPQNEHDPSAIAVDAAGEHVGFVPRELAAELAPDLDAGRPWTAVVLREQRPSPRDPRSGVTMLLSPEPVELRVRPPGRRSP